MPGSDVHILLVEDDAIDVRIIQRAFQQHRIANPMYVVRDGVEALDLLHGRNGHAPLPRPFLILLDLNLPRMDGITFLQTLRQDPSLHDSLVFVLTTSNDDRDKTAAYDQHVAGYVLKTRAGGDFLGRDTAAGTVRHHRAVSPPQLLAPPVDRSAPDIYEAGRVGQVKINARSLPAACESCNEPP